MTELTMALLCLVNTLEHCGIDMIEFAWFIVGLTCGVAGSFFSLLYMGHREIAKRSKRSQDWQKVKKEVDKAIKEEWEI